MSIGALIAICVLIVVIIGLLVSLPGWAPLALIGALAVAVLLGGVIVPWRVG
jgi:hypothetical protein